MPLIDNDLLSIQEARILLERADGAARVLEALGDPTAMSFLLALREELAPRCRDFAEQAVEESDFGTVEGEAEYAAWVLGDLLDEVVNEPGVQRIGTGVWSGGVAAGIPKGVVVSFLPEWLSVPVMLSHAVFAARARCPIIFSAPRRVHGACQRAFEALSAVAEHTGYPLEALGFLRTPAREGDGLLAAHPVARVLIDARECDRVCGAEMPGKDVYLASIGNNPVFVEATADLAHCAEEVVLGKSYHHGLNPGAEQALVVEAEVDGRFREELRRRGCRFLTDGEADRLRRVLFAPDGAPYHELIGKSAFDLARRSGIEAAETTKVLMVERPYVSESSPFSKAKLGPVLSYYVEEDWRGACEKCIEIILNSGDANALAVFSADAEVVRQFVLRKPVARVLVNVGTAMGGMGAHSDLPKTLTLAGPGSASSAGAGVAYRDLVRVRHVGAAADGRDAELIARASLARAEEAPRRPAPAGGSRAAGAGSRPGAGSQDWFSSLLESIQGH